MEKRVDIYIEKIREAAALPFYAHEGDAGMDVCAAEDLLLAPGETKLVPTGLILHIPVGYEVQVRPRSGLSLKTPLRLPNSPGTIDSGYKDELNIVMQNTSRPPHPHRKAADLALPQETKVDDVLLISEKGNAQGSYLIRKGDRIAQLIVAPVVRAAISEGQPPSDSGQSANRGGGFGSSGLR